MVREFFNKANKLGKVFMVVATLTGAIVGGKYAVQNSYEQVKSSNKQSVLDDVVVNLGVKLNYLPEGALTYNDDTRGIDEILKDINEAVKNFEHMDKVFENNGVGLTLEEKIEILEDLIEVMAKAGNIENKALTLFDETDEFKGFSLEGTSGFYYANQLDNGNAVLPDEGGIYLNRAILEKENSSFQSVVAIIIHEMKHAIQSENFLLNDNVNEVDKLLLKNQTNFIKNRYYTNFTEINAYLNTSNTMNELYEIYRPIHIYKTTEKQYLSEIMYQLYDVECIGMGAYLMDENSTAYINDEYGYKQMTVEEVVIAGIVDLLGDAEVDFTNYEIKESQYYKDVVNHIGEENLDRVYSEYMYDYSTETLFEQLERLDAVLENNTTKLSDFEIMSQINNRVKYDFNRTQYTEEEQTAIKNFIYNNLEELTDEEVDTYFSEYENYEPIQTEDLQEEESYETEIIY